VQVLSPFSVLFPNNEAVALAYNPLFALYRFDRPSPGDTAHTLLWNFISYRRQATQRSFHLGPIFSSETRADRKRIAIGCGLLGLERETQQTRWRFFVYKFKRRSTDHASTQP
jgi:hypothetical protein